MYFTYLAKISAISIEHISFYICMINYTYIYIYILIIKKKTLIISLKKGLVGPRAQTF